MMRYFVLVAILCCTGCAFAPFTDVPKAGRVEGPVSPTATFAGELRAAAIVGWPLGIADEAMDGFPDTEFLGQTLVGGYFTFLFPGRPADINFGYMTRYGVQLRIDNYRLKLYEDPYLWLASVDITSFTGSFAIFQIPNEHRVVGFHADVGLGWAFIATSRGRNLKQLDEFYGGYTDISSDDTFLFSIGGGLDFYLSRELFISLGCRYVFMSIWTDWVVDGIPMFDVDIMNADTIQTCLSFGVRF